MYELVVRGEFAAAHQLVNYKGAGEAVHGHNWKVEVWIRASDLDPAGLAVDFEDLGGSLKKALSSLDHTFLNQLPPFHLLSPSAENIARYLYLELGKVLNDDRVRVSRVTVWETDSCAASYYED